MRCEEVRKLIADNLTGTLAPSVETQLQEHLATCPACHDEVADLKRIWVDLERSPAPRMEASIMRAAVIEAAAAPGLSFYRWRWDMRLVLKAAAIIVVLAGLATGASLLLSRRTETERADIKGAAAHIRGLAAAPVTLVEYGDYECPPCGSFEAIVRPLLEKYPQSLKFEFRHLPLTRMHPNALLAARVAEAAGQQDKFWMMHDRLMVSQRNWAKNPDAEAMFIELAKGLGLDMNRFLEALRSPETEKRILDEAAAAQASGIQGTPTLFINGRKIEQVQNNFEWFDHLIADELKDFEGRQLKH